MNPIFEAHKRASGDAGKMPVFGILKRGRKVQTQVIEDAKSSTLMPIIRKKVVPDSLVYSYCWRAYNSLDTQGFSPFSN